MTNETMDERSDIGNQEGDGASNENLYRAFDGSGQTRRTPSAEDDGVHDNGDGDGSNAPASRDANEARANDYRDDDAEENRPKGRTEQIKKGETHGAADEGVHDAGVERQESSAAFRFCDGNDRDQRPQRIVVIDAIENKPHDYAADQNSHGILQAGGLRS